MDLAHPFALGLITFLAWLAARLLVPAAMPMLKRYALARPNARSSHRVPTPQGAGALVMVAMLGAIGIVALVLAPGGFGPDTTRYFGTVLAAAVTLAVIGAIDDLRPLSPWLRLPAQALAVGAVVLAAPTEWVLFAGAPPAAEMGVAILAGVWFVNLTNFMDGIDEITVAGFLPLAIAVVVALAPAPDTGTPIAAALAGGLLGFWALNRHPAKVFLGDVGSLPIGLIGAALLYELACTVSLAAALILPMYHVLDATSTLLLRVKDGEALFEAHRRHAYQRAVDCGRSAGAVSRDVGAHNFVLAGLAVLAARWPAAAPYLVIGAMLLTSRLILRFRRGAP